jgi:hypothetical protein
VTHQNSADSRESAAQTLGGRYDDVVRRRRVLMVIHAVLGFGTAFAWVSRQDFYHLRHVRILFRDLPTAYALAAAWPYILSVVLCYRAANITRLGARVFFAVLLWGSLIAAAVYLSVSRDHLWLSLVLVSIGQAILFAGAARYVNKA